MNILEPEAAFGKRVEKRLRFMDKPVNFKRLPRTGVPEPGR